MDSLRASLPSIVAVPATGVDGVGPMVGTAWCSWAGEVEHRRSCPADTETKAVTPTRERPG